MWFCIVCIHTPIHRRRCGIRKWAMFDPALKHSVRLLVPTPIRFASSRVCFHGTQIILSCSVYGFYNSNNKMPKAYPLQTSLSMYADWIPGVLFEHSCEFDKLSDATAIGCFCENGDMCHTNILLQVMKTQYPQRIHFPRFQCLKVKYLRKAGYTDLRQWLATDGNVACVRSGRIFIKSEGDTRPMIFHYPSSIWYNPYHIEKVTRV